MIVVVLIVVFVVMLKMVVIAVVMIAFPAPSDKQRTDIQKHHAHAGEQGRYLLC